MVQYFRQLDSTFAALADPTRRGILERLGQKDASISDLASAFGISLPGIRKHVRVLENAHLVRTEKVGRVRTCKLAPRSLQNESDWIENYRQVLEARLDRLGQFLDDTKGSTR